MLTCFTSNQSKNPIPILILTQAQYQHWLPKQSKQIKNWLSANNFRGDPGNVISFPNKEGQIETVLFCIANQDNFWSVGSLPFTLPEGIYSFDVNKKDCQRFAIAWGLGAYQFNQYKKPKRKSAQLVLTKELNPAEINHIVESIYLVRDLINTPTDDMGPSEFAKAAMQFAKKHQMKFKQIVGKDLLQQNFPMVYTVGRASDDAPRLIDLRFGNKKNPRVTLVGKGVCFDTGGLDIKSSQAMLLMKKDMAGGAHVLGLAQMIIAAKLPINLRVLIPVVENAVSGNAYRPGDIIKSRKGLTIEIGNTDAEGRLILADALTEAVSEKPDLLIDISTLTGAARIALGTELPAVFSNNDKVVHELIQHANLASDPIWRLPLFSLYRESLNSVIADINNAGSDSYGGAITAALFLKEFVPDDIPWLHFDLMAWNLKSRPGRPSGGEAMALRGILSYLQARFKLSF